jgi:hypothetical protein
MSLIEVVKLLTVCEIDELLVVNNKFAPFFKDKGLFIELIEMLYNYWRRLERVTVVHNNRMGDGLQNVRFVQANQLLNELILSIYRRTEETVMGYSHSVYRQTIAGANAGLMLNDMQWNCPIEYKGACIYTIYRNSSYQSSLYFIYEEEYKRWYFSGTSNKPIG